MIVLLVGGSLSNLTREDIKTPETIRQEPWVGKANATHPPNSFMKPTGKSLLSTNLISKSTCCFHSVAIWFSRVFLVWFGLVWFGLDLGFFCSYALGRVLEKRQTKSWTQRMPKSERMVLTVREEVKRELNYIYSPRPPSPSNVGLVLKSLKAPLTSQLKATFQSW